MSAQISQDLLEFRTVILSLISYATHPKLDTLIEKLTPNCKASVRFCIKMEIKRLSRPCTLVMDFRPFFEQCEPVKHQNICHYLDEISKTLFLESLEHNNGHYSVHIYNEISQKAKVRHIENQSESQRSKEIQKIVTDSVKLLSLANDNICRDAPIKTQSKCRLFSYDPLGMSRKGKEDLGIAVSILDLNSCNCLIKSQLGAVDADTEVIYLWLYDHDRDLHFNDEIILQFTIEERKTSPAGTFTHFRLKLNKSTETAMITVFTELLNKRQQVSNSGQSKQIKPLIDSITAKSHEQFILTRTHDIPMICAQYQTGWRPSAGLQTDSNQALWNFFCAGENNEPLARLFSNMAIQNALSTQSGFDTYAYVLRHQYDDQTQYIVMWQEQLNDAPSAKKFLAKHILTGDYRYIRFRSQTIDASKDAYLPSAVPSYVSPAMAMLNRPHCQQASSLLKASNQMVILSDVTDINHTMALPKALHVTMQKISNDAPIKCPTRYCLPQLPKKSSLEVVRVENNDFRAEDRFEHGFNITVTRCGNVPCNIDGITTNISTRGLAISLNEPLKYKPGAELRLKIDMPYRGKTMTLPNQVYQVIGGSSQALRLVINVPENKHAACQTLREYIYQHMDELKASGFGNNETYGLQRAIRNIYANHHLSVPFFIHQDKRQWFINSLAMNKNTDIPSLKTAHLSSQEMLLQLVNQEKFRNYCLSVINKIDKNNPVEAFYLLALPRQQKDNGKPTFWFQDLKYLQATGRLVEFIEKIRLLGEPTILRVQLSKPSRVMDKYFRDELQYLEQISPQNAQDIVSDIEQVVGIGEITDHTRQILEIFDNCLSVKQKFSFAQAS